MSETQEGKNITPQPIDIDALLNKSEKVDYYDDDITELKFLVSNPTCFVVLGKPGAGKTSIARKISQNWHCELVNPTEVILQNMEMETEMGMKAREMLYRGEAVAEQMVAKMIEDKINSPEVAHHGYVLDGLPSLCEDYMTIKDQLEHIKNLKLKPDFIIHVKVPDADLEKRRIGQKVDPLTGEIYTSDLWNPDKPEPKPKHESEDDEEEEEEEAEEEEEGEDNASPAIVLPADTIERLLIRPEDLPNHVLDNVAHYRSSMLRILEDHMADHDQQYLVELDGNQPITVLEKQVLAKLNCFNIRPAAVPVRLADIEEEETVEDTETDELLRNLGPKNMVAPRFRWRRSKWLRYCPVALQEGLLLPGKAEFACGFLDKLYLMSSPEAFAKFLKNPRPYLLPPQPRPPAKFAVMGPPLSGTTTLSNLLAKRYGAKVVDVQAKLNPKIAEERAKHIETVKQETTESAIEQVKRKLKEAQEAAAEAARLEAERLAAEEAERLAREAAEKEAAALAAAEEGEDGEKPDQTGETKAEDEPAADAAEEELEGEGQTDGETAEEKTDAEKEDDDDADKTAEEESPKPTSPTPIPEVEVDASHEDVKVIVDNAIKLAQEHPITLPADVVVDLVEAAIKEIEEELAVKRPDGPRYGGWILDNFPQTREQWALMSDKNLLPDDVVFLRDHSEGGVKLLKRWYSLNKEQVDQQIEERLAKAAEAKRLEQEERRRREEEEKRLAEEEEKQRKANERTRRIEAGEDPVEVDREIYGIIPESELAAQAEAEEAAAATAAESAVEGVTPLGTTDAEGGLTTPAVDDSAVTADETEGDAKSPTPAPAEETNAEGEGAEDVSAEASASANEISEAPSQAVAADEEDKVEVAGTVSDTPLTEATSSAEVLADAANQKELPEEGPELEAAREKRKEWDREYPNIEGVFSSTGIIEPIQIDIEEADVDNVLKQSIDKIEKRFEYAGWEYTGMDLDEEEEDAAAEAEQNEEEVEEEEEEEEGDPNRNKKKPLGDLNHFCPVALAEKNVLWPGNPECSAKYREKVYYLSNDDNRIKFLENPTAYLSRECPKKPPALRLLVLGAKGSGKSLHSRQLASRHGLFHIQFEERLQEMLMKKTKKLIGPFFDAEEEFKDSPEDIDEDKELDEFEKTFTMADLDVVEKVEDEGEVEESERKTSTDDEAKDETEEEAEVEFTEEEEAIRTFLEGGMEDMLPPELLEKIIGEFWDKEPFRSTGFILEGFPRTPEEVRWLADSGYFADTAITINSEDSDIIGRLLPPKMELWKAKRDRKLARKQRQKDKAKKIREKEIEKRRRELTREKEKKAEERRAEKEAARAEMDEEEEAEEEAEEEEEEEEEDIEAVLAEEFEVEEEEDDDEEETEEDARDRLSNDLAELYDNDTNRLSSVTETLEDVLIPHVEVEGGRKPHIIRYQLSKALKPYTEFRESMFERAYPISEKLADKMIAVGYKQPSRFGRWCPVQLAEGGCIQPMHGIGFPSFPVIYRGYIYYLSSAQNREHFIQNPLHYLKQPSPKPVVPIRMALIGPPKSGKTTLARRFESEYGVVRVSLGDAMRLVLSSQPKTALANQLQACLKKGEPVSDEIAIAALQVALMDMNCSTRGYILDGFPMNEKQVELMTAASIIPVRVIELQCSNMEVMVRATKDRLDPSRSYPKHDSAQIATVKINSYYEQVEKIRKWYINAHMNYDLIKVEKSKWWVWNEALDIAQKSVRTIQTYLEKVAEGKAASVYDLCITPNEFKARLGDFRLYCPVSLAAGELVDCGVTESLLYAVEFRGHYYKCAGEKERDMFLAEPEKYVPPLAPRRLPAEDILPRRLTEDQAKAMFPMPLELKGYCPVTFLDGKLRYEAIIPGKIELGCALYRNKLYVFESEEKLLKFLRLPEMYWDLKLPHKLPPRKDPLNVTRLPMLGYMEETVSLPVTKALNRCGKFKPKFPFLSATQSALIYIAYHLKAFNPKSSEYVRKKYKKKLEQFEETCNLIRYLGNNMTVRYREPEARPIDFNHKLHQFLDLQSHQTV